MTTSDNGNEHQDHAHVTQPKVTEAARKQLEDIRHVDLQVQGKCSECGEAKLVLSAIGQIKCSNQACPDRLGVHKVLMNTAGETAHLVQLGPYDYTILHPLAERKDGIIFDHCPLHTYMNSVFSAPAGPGMYRVKPATAEGQWVWEPLT